MTAIPSPASPRIPPLEPPFGETLQALLTKMTPPGAPNILALFRVLARHPALAERMTALGAFFLGKPSLLARRDREVVIIRTCVRCGATYEWGVHVTAFSEAVGLTPDQVRALVDPAADDTSLTERDRLLVRLADELHDTSGIGDPLWAQLAAHWQADQLIELLVLAGWYHAISFVCNGARVPVESWAAG